MAKSNGSSVDPAVAELAAVKRLLILALLRSGTTQKQVADALGLHPSQMSRMFPNGVATLSRGAS